MRSYLTNERQRQIDVILDDILLKIGKTYPENNLEDIVESYDGITAWEYDFGKDSDKISGAIAYTSEPNPKPRIYINKDLSPERKTFTLAHEFGHFILHNGCGKFRLDFFDMYSDEEAKDETEANYFAASLLMPEERFLKFYEAGLDEKSIAEYFGVSVAAVRVRLAWIRQN